MEKIIVTIRGEKILVSSPYHPQLPSCAKSVGGRWDGKQKAWKYSVRDMVAVRKVYEDIYGYFDVFPTNSLCTVFVAADERHSYNGTVYMFGRKLVSRRDRDAPVSLGDGVVVEAGEFCNSGGSLNYPHPEAIEGTILKIYDVPLAAIESWGDDDDIIRYVEQQPAVKDLIEQRAKAATYYREAEQTLSNTAPFFYAI